ncbi:hypothetical protein GCM10023065_21050 [Microbacterium laevaniformans]|uniref:sulfate permease n=1 Tax=Microbacterium laevaniformans TaxID=36807 RepID=UPI00195707D5|nr:sulfate permease [Microbacterium laevaniformans]MBM7753060.1 hypothetical protein [Microbacterium laevaniformans]GLJ64851.1 hypothetical protein GCM10017578_17400 [Microbacterium laevaniformans]
MFRLILPATAKAHGLLAYAPSNLLLDYIRTRREPKWAMWAMLIAVPYFAVAYWCTTMIDNGGPGWLHLVVLICIWNALKFLIMGPVSLAWITRDHVRARQQAGADADVLAARAGAPAAHEALPGDEHRPTDRGRVADTLHP